MALSISSRIFSKPRKRCSLSCFFFKSKVKMRFMQFMRNLIHSKSKPRTPKTSGMPLINTLKLQLNVSCNVVFLYKSAISFSTSALFFTSIAIFKPFKSVSSRMSLISLYFPCLMPSMILSIITSMVVVYGISVISITLFFLS